MTGRAGRIPGAGPAGCGQPGTRLQMLVAVEASALTLKVLLQAIEAGPPIVRAEHQQHFIAFGIAIEVYQQGVRCSDLTINLDRHSFVVSKIPYRLVLLISLALFVRRDSVVAR